VDLAGVLKEILHGNDLDGNSGAGSGGTHDDTGSMLLDVEGSRVQVSEDASPGQAFLHGFSEKVGHDQEE
jgi:hypothetical protein